MIDIEGFGFSVALWRFENPPNTWTAMNVECIQEQLEAVLWGWA